VSEIKVLIADDEENICKLLEEYITSLGCTVDVACDGKKALEHLNSRAYDFVFLDCNMPELTGVEVARYLKGRRPKPRIIMMTGYGPMDEEFAKAVGVDVYLKKPILLEEVNKIIRGGHGR
jgi:CheY-like chemotaxis protein